MQGKNIAINPVTSLFWITYIKEDYKKEKSPSFSILYMYIFKIIN